MFVESIQANAHELLGEAAASSFPCIVCESQSPLFDSSLSLTLRAILPKRLPEGQKFVFRVRERRYLSGTSNSDILRNICSSCEISREDASSTFRIVRVIMPDEAWDTWNEELAGYKRNSTVEAYLGRVSKSICYISTCKQSVILFSDFKSIRAWHLMQSALPVMFPWLFKEPLDENERNLLMSLSTKDSSQYLKAADKIAEQYDFRTMTIKSTLNGFETLFEQRKIIAVTRDLERARNAIDDLFERASSAMAEERDLKTTLLGLQARISGNSSDAESEIETFFLTHKNLTIRSLSDGTLRYYVESYLDFFDEDAYDSCVKTMRCGIFRSFSQDASEQLKLKRLLEHVYAKRTLKLRCCAEFAFNVDAMSISAIARTSYPAKISKNSYPNPHLQNHACTDGNRRVWSQMLREGNYIGALEQTIACAKTITFTDGTVSSEMGSEFARMLRNTDSAPRCFELPDGTLMTLEEAFKWLEKIEDAERAK